MIEKGKISALQMSLMIVPTIIATVVLIVPAITGKYAERDMWISPILASLNGFFTVLIVYKLHKCYPNETFIQYSKHIIGRLPGKVLGLAYLFFLLHLCGIICREYADFVIVSFLPKTPMIVVAGSLIFVCAFAVRGGVEVLGRAAQLLVPLFLLPPLLFFLLIPDFKFENIFPIAGHGMIPPILGAIVPQAWFSEIFLISILLPFVKDREKGRKFGMITVLFTMFILVFTNIVNIFLFGATVSSFNYPVFTAFRYISIGDFFEHLESIVIALWVLGAFIKVAVFYYVLVIGTAQWLNLSDYRPIVFPLGFLITIFSIWVTANAQEMGHFLETIYPFYGTIGFTFIPLLLLIFNLFRKKLKNR
ncbi:endospore germination permease [Bacillus xiapuensis]|uniref:Endospore germination permease n=2 Tax=Bacillus xiapuensis TaxID=2014075 RepID=A0ABU6NE62_9BACI|nr:endospore germination permease [Bacillus xiapuensis]